MKYFPVKEHVLLSKEIIFCQRKLFSVKENYLNRNKIVFLYQNWKMERDLIKKGDGEEVLTLRSGTRIRFKNELMVW